MKRFKPLLLLTLLAATSLAASFAFTADVVSDRDIALASRITGPALERLSEQGPAAHEIAIMRSYGLAGVDAVLSKLKTHPNSENLRAAVDAVAGQKGAADCRLFWYTDLSQAKAAAASSQKPILYLRLLGKLTDEYSCANSRFFRTVLYPDPKVSAYLRENFILVWESERPVPVVTIDFGDGRTLKRTLTGNSIHYVLDKDGNVIDAMPGLYSPNQFLKILTQARTYRAEDALAYHTAATEGIATDWGVSPVAAVRPAAVREAAAPREAAIAMENTRSKSMSFERPALTQISPEYKRELDRAALEADWARWEASARWRPVKLSPQSVAVIQRQTALANPSPRDLATIVARFESNIALETARNDSLLRSQIHAWLVQPARPETKTLSAINTRVYAELFRTPSTDPWLGLMDPTAYSALTEQPQSQSQPQSASRLSVVPAN